MSEKLRDELTASTKQLDSLVAKLLDRNKALEDSLKELVFLKDWKDQYGKDKDYLSRQPEAWEKAKRLVPIEAMPERAYEELNVAYILGSLVDGKFASEAGPFARLSEAKAFAGIGRADQFIFKCSTTTKPIKVARFALDVYAWVDIA